MVNHRLSTVSKILGTYCNQQSKVDWNQRLRNQAVRRSTVLCAGSGKIIAVVIDVDSLECHSPELPELIPNSPGVSGFRSLLLRNAISTIVCYSLGMMPARQILISGHTTTSR